MKFIIDPSNAVSGNSLHLIILGFSIELSDISGSGKIAVTEELGKISIEALPTIKNVSVEEIVLHAVANEELLEKPLNESLSAVHNISPDTLFKKLAALRRQIAEEANLPPYIIFHDTTLKDMISKMPVDLDEMQEVSGVRKSKLEKYGVRFVDVIREHIANSNLGKETGFHEV